MNVELEGQWGHTWIHTISVIICELGNWCRFGAFGEGCFAIYFSTFGGSKIPPWKEHCSFGY